MPTTDLLFRLRVRNAADTADALVITSEPGGTNPHIAAEPTGDGQSLDPLSGRVSVGAYTVRVIDAVTSLALTSLVDSDGLEYADLTALDAAWPETDTLGAASVWSISTSEVEQGAYSARCAVTGSVAADLDTYRTRTFTGLTPSTLHTVRLRVWENEEASGDGGIACGLQVVGGGSQYVEQDGTVGFWQDFEVTGTSDASGELAVRFGFFGTILATYGRVAYFDDLRIYESVSAESRVVTSYLADDDGRQQLLSRKAFVEESTDDGGSWDNLRSGYVNRIALIDALTYDITVGETRRIEQSTRIFDVIEPGLERASCIIGGPIRGNFGPARDRGLPRFSAVGTIFDTYVTLRYTGGNLYAPSTESGPNVPEDLTDFINTLAQPYWGATSSFDEVLAPFPDLIARLYDIEAQPGDVEGLDNHDFTPVSAVPRVLLEHTPPIITLYWPSGGTRPDGTAYPAQPSDGARYKMAIFPRSISESNPLHYTGHPMDLLKVIYDLRGITYNDASRLTVRAALGDDLEFSLRITQGSVVQQFVESHIFAPFGVAARVNTDAELEFFTTRIRDSGSPADTITVDDLQSDEGTVWELDEESAANKVSFSTTRFGLYTPINPNPMPETGDVPIDYLITAEHRVEVEADDPGQVFGDRAVSYAVPGFIHRTGGAQFDLEPYVRGIAADVFDVHGRGAITSEIAVLRGVTTATVGQEVTLDLAHMPTANPGDVPVSQRGSVARTALLLRRTETPEGPRLKVQDRGVATQVGTSPTFTIAAKDGTSKKIVTVTITNTATLIVAGVTADVQMAIAASTPSGGTIVRRFAPGDTSPFDLDPVDAGSHVWVRMRGSIAGQRPTAWTAWQDVDLTDLVAPSSLAGTVTGTYVDLTWVVGEATEPVEVLLRLASDTELDSVVTLPAGSTAYRLYFDTGATNYVIGVRHHEAEPFNGVSATVTLSKTSGAAPTLNPPVDPAVFAGSVVNGSLRIDGTYGLEVTGTEFPSDVEVAEAVETSVGSGTFGSYTTVRSVATVQSGRTRITLGPAPNDGLYRRLKARHTRDGATASAYTTPLDVLPWSATALPPAAPVLRATFDTSGTLTVYSDGDALTLSHKILADLAGTPTDADVRAETALNGRAVSTTFALAATVGQTATIKAFAYSNVDGGGTESAAAILTVVMGGGSPTDAQYLVLAATGSLTEERVFTPSARFSATDGGAGAAYTLDLSTNSRAVGFGFRLASTSALATGEYMEADLEVPVTCTVTGWTLLADTSTTTTLDVWKDSYANYPPTVADTIFGTKPSLTAATKNQATGLSIALTAGQILRVTIDANNNATKLVLAFTGTRT